MHIILLAVLAVLFVAFVGYQRYTAYVKNLYGPVVSAKAKLTRKEMRNSTRLDASGTMASDDICQLVYTLEAGNEVTLNVSQKTYDNAPENEWGTLTYQGKQFIGFEFQAEGL